MGGALPEYGSGTHLKPARDAMQKVCKARMISFGQAGNGAKL